MGGQYGFYAMIVEIVSGWIGGRLGRYLVDQMMPEPTSFFEQDLHSALREFWLGYPLGVLIGVLVAGTVMFALRHRWDQLKWSALSAVSFVALVIMSTYVFRSLLPMIAILYLGLPLWTTFVFTLVGSKINTGRWFPAS